MNSLISSGLLAAGMLLGQTGEPPTTRKTVIVLAPVAGQQGPQQQQSGSESNAGYHSENNVYQAK